jgi:hypothetical protein
MKPTINRCLLALIIFCCESNYIFAQNGAYYVEKRKCTYQSKKGYKLVLHYNSQGLDVQSFAYGYGLENFIKLNDSCKLILIKDLLSYSSDTSVCCLDIVANSFNGIEGCRGEDYTSDHYSIQIDALFMINRLCWPKLTELYSCYTVLYDTLKKVDINSDPAKIEIVFREYKKWFKECQRNEKISRYFPFNDGRFVWAGGRKSIARKDE